MKYTCRPSGDTSYCVPQCPDPTRGTFQGIGRSEGELSAGFMQHRSTTKAAVAIDIEKLAPITAPDGLAAAIAGHDSTTRRARRRPDGRVRPASLFRHVGEPLPVRRQPRVVLGEASGRGPGNHPAKGC
jgi:hypothetical protein